VRNNIVARVLVHFLEKSVVWFSRGRRFGFAPRLISFCSTRVVGRAAKFFLENAKNTRRRNDYIVSPPDRLKFDEKSVFHFFFAKRKTPQLRVLLSECVLRRSYFGS